MLFPHTCAEWLSTARAGPHYGRSFRPIIEALYACGHVGCQPDSVRVLLASKNPNRYVRARLFFVSRCADRVVTNLALRTHLNREQSFCRLLCESAICRRQGRDHSCGNCGTDRRQIDLGRAVGFHLHLPVARSQKIRGSPLQPAAQPET